MNYCINLDYGMRKIWEKNETNDKNFITKQILKSKILVNSKLIFVILLYLYNIKMVHKISVIFHEKRKFINMFSLLCNA